MTVQFLVGSGSTHNLIQSKLARLLDYLVTPSNFFKVLVGKGETLQFSSLCLQVPNKLQGY